MTKPIYVLNGPNLNLLGSREPQVYGSETLEDVRARCERKAAKLGFVIVNAGAFTHSSIAMLDALLASELPCVEVHLSNIFQRESFRHNSYI